MIAAVCYASNVVRYVRAAWSDMREACQSVCTKSVDRCARGVSSAARETYRLLICTRTMNVMTEPIHSLPVLICNEPQC